MRIEELLLHEFETAREQMRATEVAQDKAVKLFGAIIVALVTFTIKGDLPDSGYLLAAVVLFVSNVYVAALSHSKVSAAASMRISELRIRRWASEEFVGQVLFDLSERYRYLRMGFPRQRAFRRIHRHLRTALLVGIYVLFISKGAAALTYSLEMVVPLVATGLTILVLFSLVTWIENQRLKRRFAWLIEAEGGELPRLEAVFRTPPEATGLVPDTEMEIEKVANSGR